MRKNQKKMKVEGNGMSVFSFMFAVGTAAGLFIAESKLFSGYVYAIASLFFYLATASASASALALALPEIRITFQRKNFSMAMLAAAFLCSGIFGASLDSALAVHPRPAYTASHPKEGQNSISGILQVSAHSLQKTIDSIPYANSSSNALVKALVTGDRSGLSRELTNSFRKSGASHLLALSGMHLGIIYIIFSHILSLAGNSPSSKKFKAAISICAAGFYSLMTGAGPSIIRAFLFICINETAVCLNRKSNPPNTFCTALLIQLAFSPSSALSAGFQLSYLAMAGIYFLYPSMKRWYGSLILTTGRKQPVPDKTKSDPMQKLWNAAALSISCQIFTAPAAWLHFRSFPVYFLITNLIAVPLTTVVIQLAIAVTILHSAGICPGFLTKVSEQAIRLLIFCISVIGE